MATQPPRSRTREEERRLSIRTLAIASAASAAAALVTSQFWIQGTWVAAAMTPVIVAVVSELLNRPTEAVARRVTSDRPAIQRPGPEPPPVTVYGSGRSRRRKFALGLVAVTAALGFAIGAVALTVPELLLGRSIGHDDRDSTLIPAKKKKDEKPEEQAPQEEQTTPPETQPEQTTPPETQPEQTTPPETQTQPTTPAPKPGQQPGEPAP
jgi:hypothetical protein